jgi:hypothetical protein
MPHNKLKSLLKDLGGSRTLVSNWWLVNSFLGPKKLVAPEK